MTKKKNKTARRAIVVAMAALVLPSQKNGTFSLDQAMDALSDRVTGSGK